jgi:hypothetical protein
MVVAGIGGSVRHAFDVFFAWLPHLIGALVLLVLGYLLARVVGRLVTAGLRRAGLDRVVHSNTGGAAIRRLVPRPADLLGTIAFWAIFFSAISLAVSALGVAALKTFMASVWGYLPNVLAAVLIFLVAGVVAAAVARLASHLMGDTPLGKGVATAVPVLVMTVATFMILDQLKVAHNVVVITYAALLGAIALGSALAFGLGGREVAGRLLEGAYQHGQENSDQWRHDLSSGISRAKEGASSMRDEHENDTVVGTARGPATVGREVHDGDHRPVHQA